MQSIFKVVIAKLGHSEAWSSTRHQSDSLKMVFKVTVHSDLEISDIYTHTHMHIYAIRYITEY